jgi:ketosteroid isomerase-like protein
MSQENLDLVRSIYAAWERGDYGSPKWAHPEIEFTFADGPSPGVWIGIADMTRAWTEFLAAWGQHRTDALDFQTLDDERVLVLVGASARGRTSGLDTRAEGANIFHVRDGKVTKLVLYWDRERALTDLGLKE